MNYKLSYSNRFKKHYQALENFEKNNVKNKLRLLTQNPMHPSLRTKKIKGTDNLMESSINMSIRVIWYYEDNEIIFLIDVGHHDILNKY